MPIERITLDLDSAGLYAARYAAEAKRVPLSVWISGVVRERAIAECLESYVEQDGPPGWAEEHEARIFGDEE
ncbi:hypothetical protein AB0M02_00840 [Actinoplanes sp. NPDC051861]|uniref:hypothetical protein n=1 Tax=Actinoplanes sp. NPDC051861 TaxID=3155170 RepID=UPI00343C8CB6